MFRKFNFVRVAAAIPETQPGDVEKNVHHIIKLLVESSEKGADIVLFPELSVTSYTCGDLFRQKALLDSALTGLEHIKDATKDLTAICIVGIPLMKDTMLFNTAVCLHRGSVLGVVPKTFIPNNNEYYEMRWFASANEIRKTDIKLFGETVPFKSELIFTSSDRRNFSFAIEICEDLWSVIPPSSRHSLQGAEIIFNPSASNELAGKASYRKRLIINQSGICLGAYVYASSGTGESSTDTVYGGHALVAENGKLLAESKRFLQNSQIIFHDIDLDQIRHDRINNSAFSKGQRPLDNKRETYSHISAKFITQDVTKELYRHIDPHPFVPGTLQNRKLRCEEILSIQSSGLATRLKHTGIKNTLLGLSGGLDSTLALLVTVEAYKKLSLNYDGIYCITMPGLGTSNRTKNNATALCRELGIAIQTVDIISSVRQHFKDIGHDGQTTDIVYENSQARERTQILMDTANMKNALVIGTGDLSEFALGWCTYNGDQMSMYAVNSGVPKTLVSYLITYYAESRAENAVSKILKDILDTPISPELLPPDSEGNISQITEDTIGPYELHDFFLYYAVRFGLPPQKIIFLAEKAFKGKYTNKSIIKWLRVFYQRFFSQQFKRSAVPDGPKVGTIALSPRADWRMPSDASPSAWLKDL